MSRQAWTEIALSLARVRDRLAKHAASARNDIVRRAHLERIMGVDLAARAVCSTLRERSTRFDGRRFMRIVTSGAAK